MSAQFCMACGNPLPAGAQFCFRCGAAVGATAPSPPGPGNPPGGSPPPPGAAPAPPPPLSFPQGAPGAGGADPESSRSALGSSLGLHGGRNFLLQHQLISGGRNYRVLGADKRHLFTARENFQFGTGANLLGGIMQEGAGIGLGRLGMGTRQFTWSLLDSAGNLRGHIAIQMSGYSAASTLSDPSGMPLLLVNVSRGVMGGLTATAAYPDGRPMFETRGNLIRHNFSIHDPSGAEVAKIHEAWASVRDTYNLDLVGNVDPLCPLIFAILIDREKESK